MRERLQARFAVIALLLLCAPGAIALTLMSWPMWRSMEQLTGMEAFGHSGPAGWCYLVSYCVLVGLLLLAGVVGRR